MQKRGIEFRNQVTLPIEFDGEIIKAGLRFDLLVEDVVVAELRAAKEMTPIVQAQLISYLKPSNRCLGFLINFNVPMLRDGIKRIVV